MGSVRKNTSRYKHHNNDNNNNNTLTTTKSYNPISQCPIRPFQLSKNQKPGKRSGMDVASYVRLKIYCKRNQDSNVNR